jgi:hypothetical protein
MNVNGFDTPEQAALGDIPSAYCRAIASATHGDHAYVLLDTGPETQPYPYGVFCYRVDGRWFEGNGSNGSGWSVTDESTERGMLAFWDEAPGGAAAARIRFRGATYEAPVANGFFLFVLGDIECAPFSEWPMVKGFLVDGQWALRPEPELEREAELQRAGREFARDFFENRELTGNDGGFIDIPHEGE